MSRPYPHKCGTCGEKAVVASTVSAYSTDVRHEGKVHSVVVKDMPVDQCSACEAFVLDIPAERAIDAALREHLGLLSPECMRSNLAALGVKQNALANHIGAAQETVSRWVSGTVIQSRMSDNFIRAYFGLSQLRGFLAALPENPSLGKTVEAWEPIRQEWPRHAYAYGSAIAA